MGTLRPEKTGTGYGIYGRLLSTNNQAPSLLQNQLTLDDNATVILISSSLSATDSDIDSDPSNLIFTVSNLQHGHFELTTAPGVAITQFTPIQVQGDQVYFVHDGSMDGCLEYQKYG